jgi:riboflavin synthase
MFTGIVETTGIVMDITIVDACYTFRIASQVPFPHLQLGESISVNGICLTVARIEQQDFFVTAVPETLRLTNLSQLAVDDAVNLERSMLPTTRVGGHYVQGHVDGVAKILEIRPEGEQAWLVTFSLPETLEPYLIKKGFIALDGMSITLVDVTKTTFTVTFIPHTIENTIVKNYAVGDWVNVEVDMMAKYIEKLLRARDE